MNSGNTAQKLRNFLRSFSAWTFFIKTHYQLVPAVLYFYLDGYPVENISDISLQDLGHFLSYGFTFNDYFRKKLNYVFHKKAYIVFMQ